MRSWVDNDGFGTTIPGSGSIWCSFIAAYDVWLKVGRFSYADVGQMHMYLNYAREHCMKEGENRQVGVILAVSKGDAEAHYALEYFKNTILA